MARSRTRRRMALMKKIDAAKAFVLDALKNGACGAVRSAAAKAHGYSKITLRRAVRDMPVVSQPPEGHAVWLWRFETLGRHPAARSAASNHLSPLTKAKESRQETSRNLQENRTSPRQTRQNQ